MTTRLEQTGNHGAVCTKWAMTHQANDFRDWMNTLYWLQGAMALTPVDTPENWELYKELQFLYDIGWQHLHRVTGGLASIRMEDDVA